jgi:hypothetical protein
MLEANGGPNARERAELRLVSSCLNERPSQDAKDTVAPSHLLAAPSLSHRFVLYLGIVEQAKTPLW